MKSCVFFSLFFFFFLKIEGFEPNCPELKCSDGAPDIRFPFWASGQQPQHCDIPGFELVCRENTTVIHFPSHEGYLAVKSISYNTRKLQLLDPKNCVHRVFLNLDLSLTPFQYYYVVKNYTYLNCSTRISSLFEVPCLSGSGHHVYTVESFFPVPPSCRPLKAVAIPFSYSPYLADNSFGLGLTWSLPACEDCEAKVGQCESRPQTRCFNRGQNKGFPVKHFTLGEIFTKGNYLKVLLCILVVTTLVAIKKHHSKKLDTYRQRENENLLEALRDGKALNL